MWRGASLSRDSPMGGQPTGVVLSAVALRMRLVASPRRKIWISWPASARASAWAKTNAARVGWSESPALFIMIFRGFLVWSAALVPKARRGRPASWAKNLRRAMWAALVEVGPKELGTLYDEDGVESKRRG